MAHYKLMYPSEYLAACDLQGKDVRVTIEAIAIEEIPGTDGKKQKKPVLKFVKGHKRMVLNKTCAKTVARQHGNDTND